MKKTLIMMLAALVLTGCQESLEDRCEREAKDYTAKKCPALLTEGVTIDSLVFYKSTHTLTYYYTLSGVLDNAEALESHDFRSILLRELRNSPDLNLYKEAGYNFGYVYYSQKQRGTQLLNTTFRSKDYR